MNKRYKLMARKGLKSAHNEDIYICIDELADLLISDSRKVILNKLQRLLQLGRAANIHVIACTQVPNRRIIPAELTLNFTAKVGLRTDSAIESRQVIGSNGCEKLEPYGYGYYKKPALTELWRMPFTSEYDLAQAVQRNRQLNRLKQLRLSFILK